MDPGTLRADVSFSPQKVYKANQRVYTQGSHPHPNGPAMSLLASMRACCQGPTRFSSQSDVTRCDKVFPRRLLLTAILHPRLPLTLYIKGKRKGKGRGLLGD